MRVRGWPNSNSYITYFAQTSVVLQLPTSCFLHWNSVDDALKESSVVPVAVCRFNLRESTVWDVCALKVQGEQSMIQEGQYIYNTLRPLMENHEGHRDKVKLWWLSIQTPSGCIYIVQKYQAACSYMLFHVFSIYMIFVCLSEWACECVSACTARKSVGMWVHSHVWGGTLTQACCVEHFSPSSFPPFSLRWEEKWVREGYEHPSKFEQAFGGNYTKSSRAITNVILQLFLH